MTDSLSLKTQLQKRLQAVEDADSAQAMLDAVEALAELKEEGAIYMLIRVLGYNNPGAAVAAVEGLIQIGTPAATALLSQIDGYNYGARAWALRVLSGIGDPRGLDLILETAAEDFSLSVRRAAAKGLGSIQWEKLPADEQQTAQTKARDVLLKIVSSDPEWVVRYAAVVGLQGVAVALVTTLGLQTSGVQTSGVQVSEQIQPIVKGLSDRAKSDEALAVQARAQWALTEIA